MPLLSTLPDLQSICTAVGGNNLFDAIAYANNYPYRWDSAYANVATKDRQSNFGMYGDPTITLSTTWREWAYNSTSTQTFTVQCNHSTWKFHPDSDVTGFTVTVWNWSNSTQLGSYDNTTLYPTDCTVRITPNAQNGGTTDKNFFIYCGTFNGYLITGGSVSGVQYAQVVQPRIDFSSSGLTLSGVSYSITIGSPSVTVWWTPSGMATSPHINYVMVTKSGPTTLYSGSKATCSNGVATSLSFNLNENAVNGGIYYCQINYDNA